MVMQLSLASWRRDIYPRRGAQTPASLWLGHPISGDGWTYCPYQPNKALMSNLEGEISTREPRVARPSLSGL